MAKTRRPKDRPGLKALITWWHERRRELQPDWWADSEVDELAALGLRREVSALWLDHGRSILLELQENRRDLERTAKKAFARTGEWLVGLGSILAGKVWNGKPDSLSALAEWYRFRGQPMGLAERLRLDLEGEWPTGAVFYPEFTLSNLADGTGGDLAFNESLANALKRLRVNGLEPLYDAAKWLEKRLPEALLHAAKLERVRRTPLEIPAATVANAVSSLHQSVGDVVYEAVLQAAKELTEAHRDDIHEVLDEALFAQIDYALQRKPEQLDELVDRQRISPWPYVVVLPLLMTGSGLGVGHASDVAGIQRATSWMQGLDGVWQEWMSLTAPNSSIAREESLSRLWFKVACGQISSERDRAVALAAALTFLLGRISSACAAEVGTEAFPLATKLPLKAQRVEDCQVQVKFGEGQAVVTVPGHKGTAVSVKPSIMKMLESGLSGTFPRPKNPNAATHLRHWFSEHFQVLGSDHAEPLKLNDDGNAYVIRFALSLFDADVYIGEAQFSGRVKAQLRAEHRASQRRRDKDATDASDRVLELRDRVRTAFQEEHGRPPTEAEVAAVIELARERDLLPE